MGTISTIGRNILARRQGASHSNPAHFAAMKARKIAKNKSEEELPKPTKREHNIQKAHAVTILHPGVFTEDAKIQKIREDLTTPSSIMRIEHHRFFIGSPNNFNMNGRVIRPSRHKVFNW